MFLEVGGQVAKHHITKAEARRLSKFMSAMASYLGQPRWWFEVDTTRTPGKDILASIDVGRQRYEATIKICRGWSAMRNDEQLNTIVHEVCHLIHRRIDSVIEDASALMHGHEWSALNDRYKLEIELVIDQLAMTLTHTHEVQQLWHDAHQ